MSEIPKFDLGWHPSDAEADVLSTCSTLVFTVQVDDWPSDLYGKNVVQFAHFSVKEYLTSDCIANLALVSHFYIHPKPAHTLLAKVCLSVLLQLGHKVDKTKS